MIEESLTRSGSLYFSPLSLQKITIHFARKNIENFVIFSEIMLDIFMIRCYIIQARVGKLRVHCDDAGDCAERR